MGEGERETTMRNGIMVPLDGTRFAEAALPLALALARRDGLPICLVTVWQPVLPLYDTSGWLEAWEQAQSSQPASWGTASDHCMRQARAQPVQPPLEKLIFSFGLPLCFIEVSNLPRRLDAVALEPGQRTFQARLAVNNIREPCIDTKRLFYCCRAAP